jgi:hypothetical protein
MDFNTQTVCVWMTWYEKAAYFFALFYPVLGVVVARRRLASGNGNVVALATLPLTVGAVTLWLGLFSMADGIRIAGTSDTVMVGLGEVAVPLFVACLSTLLVLAGTLPYRVRGGERPRSTRLTSVANGAPFVLAAAGLAYGVVLLHSSAPTGSLAGTVLGVALIGLHLFAISLRVPPESRATAVTVFVLTVILAAVVWQYSQHFRVVVD